MHREDMRIAAELEREDATAIQKNKHNTVPNTMRRNIARHVHATERVREAQSLKRRVESMTDEISHHRGEARRLQAEKENLTVAAKKKKTR